MQVSFGKRPGGGLGGLPNFDVSDWNLVSQGDRSLLYIPGFDTFFRRLGITLLCAVFALIAWFTFSPMGAVSNSAELRELRQETKAALAGLEESLRDMGMDEQAVAAARARRTAEVGVVRDDLASMRSVSTQLLYGSWGALAFVGVLAPLSCLWNRVGIRITPRGDLAVTTWGIMPATQTFSFQLFSGIQYGCEERVFYSREGAALDSYWRWFVRLQAAGNHAGVTFYPMRQQEQPLVAQSRPPKRVMSVVQFLHRHSRLPITGPLITEPRPAHRYQHGGAQQFQPVVEYSSVAHPMLDGLDPHLKAEVMGLSGGGGGGVGTKIHKEVHFTDADGRVFQASSLEDLPPDIRVQVEETMANMTPEVHTHESHSFTVRGADGRAHTYNSLDELPPELRAMYEKHRPR